MAEERYFLDWLIEPLAGIIEALTGMEHETAVMWTKGFTYLVLLVLAIAIGWKTYRWIFPKKKE